MANAESDDHAVLWWNGKERKYQGIWCAHINDNGCSQFDARLEGDQVLMTGEWERNGHRRAWREVISRPTSTSSVQTLDIGEPGAELKRVSAIHATRVASEMSDRSQSATSNGGQTISPSPEMQKLFAAQLGKWSQREERADGSTGQGEVVWRPGPGGMSLVEDEYIDGAAGEMTGLSITWYDKDVKGYRALWCSNTTKNGCLIMSKPARWEGDQFVLGDEFEKDGKKFVYKEVESQITPSTYTLTSYIGEPGGELKPTSTIHASKISAEERNNDLPAAMAKRHQAMIVGDEAVVDRLTAKEYAQTDILGHVQDKSTWMAEYFRPLGALIKRGKFRWERYEERDVRVTMLGDTAVVAGELDMKGTGATFMQGKWEEAPNKSIEGTLRFTRVWIKRDGSWLLAALHNSAPMGVQTSRP